VLFRSRLALARLTEWDSPAERVFLGLGQRLLATDQGEYPLLEIRQLVLGAAAAAQAATA
jgi:type VI secretion system protein ImpE